MAEDFILPERRRRWAYAIRRPLAVLRLDVRKRRIANALDAYVPITRDALRAKARYLGDDLDSLLLAMERDGTLKVHLLSTGQRTYLHGSSQGL